MLGSSSANAQELVEPTDLGPAGPQGLTWGVTGTAGVNRQANVNYLRTATVLVFAEGQIRVNAPANAVFDAPRTTGMHQAIARTSQFSSRGTITWLLRRGGLQR